VSLTSQAKEKGTDLLRLRVDAKNWKNAFAERDKQGAASGILTRKIKKRGDHNSLREGPLPLGKDLSKEKRTLAGPPERRR